MPTVKIALLSHSDLPRIFINLVSEDLQKPVFPTVNGSMISHQDFDNLPSCELEFITINGSEDFDKIKGAHLAFYLVPSYPLSSLANNIKPSDFRHAIPSTTQAHLVFMGDGQTPEEKTFQSKLASVFPNTTILAGKRIGEEIFRLAQSAAASHKNPSADKNDLASVPLSSDDIDQPPRFISRLLGTFLRAVFGAMVSVVVYNPISSMFAALGRLRRDFDLRDNEGLLQTASAFGLLLVSPVWGPLKGLIFDGILEQAILGWQEGVKHSLMPFYYIPRYANLTQESTPISKRNIIAGIIITSLVIAAGLAVGLPVVNAALGISAYAALFGLGSLSLAQFALAASGAALIAGTSLYGLGIGVVKLGKFIANAISKQLQNDKPSAASKFFGAIAGAFYGAFAGIVIYNPVSSLFFGIRALVNVIKNKYNRSVSTIVTRALLLLTAFVWLPLYETFMVGLWDQGKRGSQVGIITILVGAEKENSAAAAVYGDFRPQKRDVIAGLVITGLMVAAGLAVVIAPVSIFLGIPALLTTYGLAGIAPWSLALIASGATLGATSILYGVSSILYDVYDAWRHTKASSAAKTPAIAADHSSQTSSAAEATRRMRRHAGNSSLEAESIEPPRQNSGGFLSGFTTCLAGICGGSSKKPTLRFYDDQPLLVADEAPVNKI